MNARCYHGAMKAKLIAVGERAPRWVAEGFGEYQKRLSHWLPLELVEIEPGLRGKGRDAERATADEGARVLAALPKQALIVALDGRGRTWSSEQLAQRLELPGAPACGHVPLWHHHPAHRRRHAVRQPARGA